MENLELSVVKTCFQEHGITQTSSNSLLTNENDRGCESSDIKEKRLPRTATVGVASRLNVASEKQMSKEIACLLASSRKLI